MTVSSLDVEAGVEVLLSGVVEALDAVRLRVVRHQLRVLLDHQQEASLALDGEEFRVRVCRKYNS